MTEHYKAYRLASGFLDCGAGVLTAGLSASAKGATPPESIK